MRDPDHDPLHVVPLGDKREHIINGDPCPCLPMSLEEGAVIRHNAYDGRETGEVCRKALDLLGCAMTEWTPEQRDAYDHAIAVLEMHWPEKDAEKRHPPA